jgi:hypothetical protein
MGRADARAGEHRHRGLGDHRQVDRDAVAALHAAGLERVREAADLDVELGVRQRARVAGLALPDDRALLAAAGEVLVEADRAGVDAAADEPLREGRAAPVEDLRERLDPGELAGDAAPEAIGVVDRLAQHALVVGFLGDPRLLREVARGREVAVLVQDVLDLGHPGPPGRPA